MAMAFSLEGRVPFLDHRVVEFAADVPPDFKLRGARTKFLVKEVSRKYLPSEIIDRPKAGSPYRSRAGSPRGGRAEPVCRRAMRARRASS
jgi:asparagine synthase (glutamine-hydrolysing)